MIPKQQIFFLITFFLGCFHAPESLFAQQKTIEQLESILAEEELPLEDRAQTTLDLIEAYRQSGDYEKMARQSMRYFHLPIAQENILEEKKALLLQSLTYEPEIADSNTVGSLYLKLAGAYFDLAEMDSAIANYSKALIKFSPADTLFLADAYFFRGQARDSSSDMIAAMGDYQKAYDYYTRVGDADFARFARSAMAVQLSRYAIFDEAEEIRQELMRDAEESEDWEALGVQYFNRATDLGKKEDWKGQLRNFILADSLLVLAQASPYFLVQAKFALSRAAGKLGDLSAQKKYFEAGEAIRPEVPELPNDSPIYLMTKASMSYREGKYAQAEAEAKLLLQKAETKGDFDELLAGYEILAKSQESLGKYDQALQTYKTYKEYKDSIFVANQATSFGYYQALYETEKKEVEILQKEAELAELQTANEKNIAIFAFLLVSLVVLSGFAFLYLSLRNARKKKQLQERFAQELLKTQEEERKRISKDLHDGLGQSLLLIKNKVALDSKEHTGELLDTAINELRSIARSLHPMQLEKLGLSKALEQILNQLDSETELFISSDIQELGEKLPQGTELQLYRIAQEVLNNVLKHSEAKALRFTLKSDDSQILMRIEDNGKGFDFSERFNDFSSMGLKTLKERTAAIGGQMKVNSEKGKGTKFEFNVGI
ncbi:tetratricopeptide repeat-containing sensor histidine kinase [Algoriphagus namhaensis]